MKEQCAFCDEQVAIDQACRCGAAPGERTRLRRRKFEAEVETSFPGHIAKGAKEQLWAAKISLPWGKRSGSLHPTREGAIAALWDKLEAERVAEMERVAHVGQQVEMGKPRWVDAEDVRITFGGQVYKGVDLGIGESTTGYIVRYNETEKGPGYTIQASPPTARLLADLLKAGL